MCSLVRRRPGRPAPYLAEYNHSVLLVLMDWGDVSGSQFSAYFFEDLFLTRRIFFSLVLKERQTVMSLVRSASILVLVQRGLIPRSPSVYLPV